MAHLCVYVEPSWVDPRMKVAASGEVVVLPVEELKEYQELRKSLEEKEREVSQLEARLERALPLLPPPQKERLPTGENFTVSILSKLRVSGSGEPRVANDLFYTMSGFRRKRALATSTAPSLYLWLNTIKLDPQLTALWYKITNLQKSYHLYKKGLLNERRAESPSCGHSQCPVVACEFNMMVEDASRPGTPMSSSVSVKSESTDETEKLFKRFNGGAVDLLTQLQKMWLEICNYGRGNEKLTYAQLMFLVKFYLSSHIPTCEMESRTIFRFFGAEIMGLIHQDGDEARLDIAVFLPKMSDSEVYNELRLKGVYLSMLGLIVEEALDFLRMRSGINDSITRDFHEMFPLEALHQGLGHKRSFVLNSVCLLASATPYEMNNLLCFISLRVAILNRLLLLYKRENVAIDVRTSFSNQLLAVLELLYDDGNTLEIWTDPAIVQLLSAESTPQRQFELNILLCQLWCDLLRIINIVTFGLVPIVKHTDRLNRLVDFFLLCIGEAEPYRSHTSFLEQCQSQELPDHIQNLITSTKNFYLIAKASLLLRSGIMGVFHRITIGDLTNLVADVSNASEELGLTKLKMTHYFEIKVILNHLLLFFTFLTCLQCEEKGDVDTVGKLIPILFSKSVDINKFLQSSIIQFSKVTYSKYVLAAISETISLFSHIIAGLLIRFVAENNGDHVTSSPTPNPAFLIYALQLERDSPIVIPVSTKEMVIQETYQTVNLIETSLGKESHIRATKIWRFYMTFIRNSHKMNPAAYAKLHERAFGSERLIDACPVMSNPSKSYPISSVRLEQGSCPVLHPASPVPMVPKSLSHRNSSSISGTISVCPVSLSSSVLQSQPSDLESQKRLCPFNHEALRNANSHTFQESKMRQSVSKEEAEDGCPFSKRSRPATMPLLRTLSSSNLATPVQNNPLSPTNLDLIDWDTLPNFNFDLAGDENLSLQINNDSRGNLIENMFQ